jgi:uncharacterized membrane protein YgdD (TMEM256/DUF423 family)
MPASARLMLAAAAFLAALAVLFGAFGAHALKARLSPDALALWQTAVQYQIWHALALLAIGLIASQGAPSAWLRVSALLFISGILLFCGSLYALALGAARGLGMVAPLGGTAFIVGWFCLGIWALR